MIDVLVYVVMIDDNDDELNGNWNSCVDDIHYFFRDVTPKCYLKFKISFQFRIAYAWHGARFSSSEHDTFCQSEKLPVFPDYLVPTFHWAELRDNLQRMGKIRML